MTLLPVEIGDQLHEGQIIAEISGQPVVSLGGVLPAYRDLRAGDRGRDVRQLQQALRRLGYLKNEPLTGNLDSATADAVGRLFAHDGYPDGAGVPGVVLPLSGVAYLPAFPARVLNVTAAVGQVAPDALLSIACGRLTISSSVAPDQAEFVRQDMAADVLAEGIGKQATGTVAEVGSLVTPNAGDAQTGSAAGTGPFVPFTIVTRAVLGSDWSGQDVRVTLTQAKTSTPVLIVPASAITAGADGRTTVTVQRGSTTEIVPVTAGGTGDGFVQIDAAGRLRAGDNVVIGS